MESWFWSAARELLGKPTLVLYTLPALACSVGVIVYILVKTIGEFRKK